MKRTIIVAALALTSGAAYAENLPPQYQMLLNAVVAIQMGSDDTCPRFKVIKSEARKELDDSGTDIKSELAKGVFLLVFDTIKHGDRSELCQEAWEKFGPNGSYKRQMLEAK